MSKPSTEKASSVAIASSAAASTSGSKSKLSSAELISMIRQGGPSATAGTPATTAAGAPSTRATSLKKADDEFPPLPKAATPPAAKDDYGMRGLLENIKRLPADKNIWAIGQEVESLGMPLDTPTPFTDAAMGGNSNASRLDSDWNVWGDDARQTLAASGEYKPSTLVPACFNQQPAPPASGKMASFSDETLFWIFYGMPRDRMQELAARTLMSRGWRLHKESCTWLTRCDHPELLKSDEDPDEWWVVFDVSLWDRDRRHFKGLRDEDLDKPADEPSALASVGKTRLYMPDWDALWEAAMKRRAQDSASKRAADTLHDSGTVDRSSEPRRT